MGITFPFSFASLLFSAICKASSDNHFAFLFLGNDLDCREPAQEIPPMTRSCGRDLLELLPQKPESVCLTILCLSPTLLTLTGGYPRPPFSGKNQLRALANKSVRHDRSV